MRIIPDPIGSASFAVIVVAAIAIQFVPAGWFRAVLPAFAVAIAVIGVLVARVEWRAIVKRHYAKDRRQREEENLYRYRRDRFADDIRTLQLALGLDLTEVKDLSPGQTFRRNMKGRWAMPEASLLPAKVWPTDAELFDFAGRTAKGTADYLRMRRDWAKAHR